MILDTMTAETIERGLRREFGIKCRVERVALLGGGDDLKVIMVRVATKKQGNLRFFIDITGYDDKDYAGISNHVVTKVAEAI